MDPNSLLSQLRDIQSPGAISWWPPAIGWWLLGATLLLLSALTIYTVLRWYRRSAWKRAALKELRALGSAQATAPSDKNLTQVISLLKRTLSAAYQAPNIAALGPNQWREKLNDAGSHLNEEDLVILSEGHYCPNQNTLDDAALTRIKLTIKGLKSA